MDVVGNVDELSCWNNFDVLLDDSFDTLDLDWQQSCAETTTTDDVGDSEPSCFPFVQSQLGAANRATSESDLNADHAWSSPEGAMNLGLQAFDNGYHRVSVSYETPHADSFMSNVTTDWCPEDPPATRVTAVASKDVQERFVSNWSGGMALVKDLELSPPLRTYSSGQSLQHPAVGELSLQSTFHSLLHGGRSQADSSSAEFNLRDRRRNGGTCNTMLVGQVTLPTSFEPIGYQSSQSNVEILSNGMPQRTTFSASVLPWYTCNSREKGDASPPSTENVSLQSQFSLAVPRCNIFSPSDNQRLTSKVSSEWRKQTKAPLHKKKDAICKVSKRAAIKPMNAYNYYFRDERHNITHWQHDGLPPPVADFSSEKQRRLLFQHWYEDPFKGRRLHRKTQGKLGFNELSTVIAQRWRDLSNEGRQFYKTVAHLDNIRYQKETTCKEGNENELALLFL